MVGIHFREYIFKNRLQIATFLSLIANIRYRVWSLWWFCYWIFNKLLPNDFIWLWLLKLAIQYLGKNIFHVLGHFLVYDLFWIKVVVRCECPSSWYKWCLYLRNLSDLIVFLYHLCHIRAIVHDYCVVYLISSHMREIEIFIDLSFSKLS